MDNNFRYDDPEYLTDNEIAERVAPFGMKFQFFQEHDYMPHYWQILFHTMRTEGKLTRFRHLVAGRRGGKTLSAAWELLFYALHPEHFHLDAHAKIDDRPLHAWVLTPNYPLGRQAWLTFVQAIRASGIDSRSYRMNKGDRFFEFANDTLIEFKTADNPEGLRGAGLDILWIDEAAIIPSKDAYEVARPALSDKQGIVFTTTTPLGKNWMHKTFFHDGAMRDPHHGRVQYRSLDNPHYPKEEWEYLKQTYHPLVFKREMMAAFDSMAGVELQGDWLKYYEMDDLPKSPDNKKQLALKTYLGVDPAISLSDDADRFAMALLGVTLDNHQVYLLRMYAGRIPFPEQVEKIKEWHQLYRPSLIGIEANAYQAALAQQVERLETLPPIVPFPSKGKKSERILAMAPLFRIGKVKIREDHRDFIDEWLNYDSTIKNPEDDCLDAVEIALRTAGALLPQMPQIADVDFDLPAKDLNDLARRYLPGGPLFAKAADFDDSMGSDW